MADRTESHERIARKIAEGHDFAHKVCMSWPVIRGKRWFKMDLLLRHLDEDEEYNIWKLNSRDSGAEFRQSDGELRAVVYHPMAADATLSPDEISYLCAQLKTAEDLCLEEEAMATKEIVSDE